MRIRPGGDEYRNLVTTLGIIDVDVTEVGFKTLTWLMSQGDERGPLELALLAHITADLIVAAWVVVRGVTQAAIDLSCRVPLLRWSLLIVDQDLIDDPVITPQDRGFTGLGECVRLRLRGRQRLADRLAGVAKPPGHLTDRHPISGRTSDSGKIVHRQHPCLFRLGVHENPQSPEVAAVGPFSTPIYPPKWSPFRCRFPDAYLPTNRDQPIAEHGPSRTECGLPEEGFVFCSFNNADKIEPELFDAWMRILHAIPGSILWQRSDDPLVQQNLRKEAQARTIDPSRLVFAPALPDTADHLARHCHADLFLDTLTHGGHGTAVDALWAGVPLLACPGETFTSRVSASLLKTSGLTELIARDLEEYEQIAIELANHPDRLQQLRTKLRGARNKSPLFDTARLVRHLESALLKMWQRHESRQPPQAIPEAITVG